MVGSARVTGLLAQLVSLPGRGFLISSRIRVKGENRTNDSFQLHQVDSTRFHFHLFVHRTLEPAYSP